MPTPRSGYVYFIGTERFGWYKIGQSHKAIIRIKDLGILLPFQIKIYAIWSTRDRFVSESLMHEKYTSHSINGEWFSFTQTDANELINEAQVFDMKLTPPSSAAIKFSNIRWDVIKKGPNPGKLIKKEIVQLMMQLREESDPTMPESQMQKFFGQARDVVLARYGIPLPIK